MRLQASAPAASATAITPTLATNLTKEHYLDLANGKFKTPEGPENLVQLFKNFVAESDQAAQPDSVPLVVYFHGGLVNERSGLNVAADLYPLFRGAGAYPVFFVWNAGLVEVVTNNLREIFDERIFQRLLERVIQFALGKVRQQPGARGTLLDLPDLRKVQDELRLPKSGKEPYAAFNTSRVPPQETLHPTEEKQLRDEIENDFVIQQESAAIANGAQTPEAMAADKRKARGARIQASRHTLMSPEVVREIVGASVAGAPAGATGRGGVSTLRIITGAAKVLIKVTERFAQRRDHGLYTTVVEELLREFYLANVGQLIWTQMKKDTADAFKEDATSYGGTAFLEGLSQLWQSGKHPRIILIGHSTGAVYICNFLQQAQKRGLPKDLKFEVVFLAPACTCQLFAETLASPGVRERIAKIRSFAMHDSLESADQLVPLVYPRSLLYFVSGVVEEERDAPLVGMERYYSRQAPYDSADITAVCDYFLSDLKFAIWSEAETADGLMTSATSHGDFDNNLATRNSLKHIIRNGF